MFFFNKRNSPLDLLLLLLDLSTIEKGMLKSPTIIVDLSICACISISFCLTYFDSLLLGAYTH